MDPGNAARSGLKILNTGFTTTLQFPVSKEAFSTWRFCRSHSWDRWIVTWSWYMLVRRFACMSNVAKVNIWRLVEDVLGISSSTLDYSLGIGRGASYTVVGLVTNKGNMGNLILLSLLCVEGGSWGRNVINSVIRRNVQTIRRILSRDGLCTDYL